MGLDGQPAADLLGAAISQWVGDLWASREWVQDRDADGLDAAFRDLRLSAERWPALAEFVGKLPAVKTQAYQPFAIEWDRHEVKNRSLTAKAHVTFNCARLEIPVPAWALPESDVESDAILRMIGGIKADVAAHKRQIAA